MLIGHTEPDLIADHPDSSRFVAAIVEMWLAVPRALARIIRIRRDRALLYELPDYLLRDIGINRSEIQSITWLGGRGVGHQPPLPEANHGSVDIAGEYLLI
ncbi:DUF1127 domain-containing protein [Mesorhizobium sp. M0136]|uniref:DUF1127 domain-containing protein n=1 Tax=Mesorhizobium sp. M0136 TaxID=2956890 RepID=UPI003335E56E